MKWRTDKPTADKILAILKNGIWVVLNHRKIGQSYSGISYDEEYADEYGNEYATGFIEKWADLEEEETVTDCYQLEEAAEKFARSYDQGTCDGIAQDCFKAGANWQRKQDESRKRANVTLANTYHPKDKQVEIAFEDIWLDAEVSVEAFGVVDANLTNSMKSLCHDFFEAGTDWQKEQDHDACRQCEKNYDNVFFKGEQHAIDQMKEEAVEAICFGGKEGKEYIVTFVVPYFKIKDYSLGNKAKVYIFRDNKE